MKLCNKDCIPCCDFCIHARHNYAEINGRMVKSSVVGCNLHIDEEHQYIAVGCGYCEDYHCIKAEE